MEKLQSGGLRSSGRWESWSCMYKVVHPFNKVGGVNRLKVHSFYQYINWHPLFNQPKLTSYYSSTLNQQNVVLYSLQHRLVSGGKSQYRALIFPLKSIHPKILKSPENIINIWFSAGWVTSNMAPITVPTGVVSPLSTDPTNILRRQPYWLSPSS